MLPSTIINQWVSAFNNADLQALGRLYAEDAVNHQTPNAPICGKAAIMNMFKEEFSMANMVCIVEQVIEQGDWGVLEWKDPLGLRGCGFFKIQDGLIVLQRGYWDKLSFHRLHNIPLDLTGVE